MPRVRDIHSASRATAVWLLVMFVLLSPWGIGVASASAVGANGCEVSCPCDEQQEADHHDDCDDDDDACPDDEGCSEDCPLCSSAPVAFASAAVLLVASPASSPDLVLTPSDGPAIGVSTGVFRPPRSLV